MTRKIYNALSKAIRNYKLVSDDEVVKEIELLTIDIVSEFKKVNPAFDSKRFFKACE